jgi:predicted Rossmann fold flavoprotein
MTHSADQIVVIGAGAAGFMGAIVCAEANPQAQVTLLEAGREPLAKVRISGGGRCNVTHACFEPALLVQHYPRGGKALRGAFSRFQPSHTVEWYQQRGVQLKTEADGRMFPVTDDAETIVDCLMTAARKLRIQLFTSAGVSAVTKVGDRFQVHLKSERTLVADRILIATGSSPQGHRFARELGHTIIPTAPSLFTFNITDRRLQDLAGVAVNPVKLKIQVDGEKLEQQGPLLITHWGISGPAVLKLSAWGARVLYNAHYQAELTINWLPTTNPEKLKQELLKVKGQLPKRSISGSCPVMMPRRLWESLTIAAGIDNQTRWAELSNSSLRHLIDELLQGRYQITGKGAFKEEFVTCGGVNLAEVDFKTMESKVCPGLYLAGEILDIDGVTGGFNFQSAWTTGWLAGQAMGLQS